MVVLIFGLIDAWTVDGLDIPNHNPHVNEKCVFNPPLDNESSYYQSQRHTSHDGSRVDICDPVAGVVAILPGIVRKGDWILQMPYRHDIGSLSSSPALLVRKVASSRCAILGQAFMVNLTCCGDTMCKGCISASTQFEIFFDIEDVLVLIAQRDINVKSMEMSQSFVNKQLATRVCSTPGSSFAVDVIDLADREAQYEGELENEDTLTCYPSNKRRKSTGSIKETEGLKGITRMSSISSY